MKNKKRNKVKYWVYAPDNGGCMANSICGVWVAEDEEVEWIWTYDAIYCCQYVSGYNIVKKPFYKRLLRWL